MEIALSKDQEERLLAYAELQGQPLSALLVHAAEHLMHAEAAMLADVDEALLQADQGNLIDEDEISAAWLFSSRTHEDSLDT